MKRTENQHKKQKAPGTPKHKKPKSRNSINTPRFNKAGTLTSKNKTKKIRSSRASIYKKETQKRPTLESSKETKDQSESQPEKQSTKKAKFQRLIQSKQVEISTKATAQFFNLIQKFAPSPKSSVPLISQILLIVFQTGFIFSKELSEIYSNFITEDIAARSSIMNENSFFNKLSGFFDMIMISRSLSPDMLASLMLFMILVAFALNLFFFRYEWFSKIDNLKGAKGKISQGLVKGKHGLITFFAFFLTNYDVCFFVLNTISFNSFFCRWIIVEQREGMGEGENLLDQSFESAFLTDIERVVTIKKVPLQVNYLNDSVLCKSTRHTVVFTLGVFLLIANISLRILASKVMRFLPNCKIFGSKYGNSDYMIDIVLSIILMFRSLSMIYFKDNYNTIRVLFLIYLGLLVMVYLIIFFRKPFYNTNYATLRSFQILYLINLTLMSILVRETNFKIIRTEVSTIIFMSISISLMLKLNNNLSHDGINTVIKELRDHKCLKAHTLLNLYYRMNIFFHRNIDSKLKGISMKNDTENRDTKFLINMLLDRHKKLCKKVECFCRRSPTFLKKHCFGISENLLKTEFLFESIFLTEKIFEEFFSNNKKIEDSVFYAYIEFLINFKGEPKKAKKLIHQKIEEKRIESKAKHFYNVELEAMSEKVMKLVEMNLMSGTCFLNEYEGFVKGDKNVVEIDQKLQVKGPVEYLKNFSVMKELTLQAIDHKQTFLNLLLKKNGKLSKVFKTGYEFFLVKEKVMKLNTILSEISQNQFSPLLILFGNFMLEICEDREVGTKKISKYLKLAHLRNMNEVFGDFKLAQYELMLVHVNSEKDQGAFRIEYCTSNIENFLGKILFEI